MVLSCFRNRTKICRRTVRVQNSNSQITLVNDIEIYQRIIPVWYQKQRISWIYRFELSLQPSDIVRSAIPSKCWVIDYDPFPLRTILLSPKKTQSVLTRRTLSTLR
jgi:hypothetical protein